MYKMLSTWRLGRIALVLFAMYAMIVLGSAFPIRLMNPAWQLQMITNLINSAAFPLVGLGLLCLASDLNPRDGQLARWCRWCAWLAVPVALGFLLLIPLQTMALWQQSSYVYTSRLTQVQRLERNLGALRQSVEVSTSAADLQRRLQALKGPTLGPVELSMPFPQLKKQAGAAIQEFERQLQRQSQPPPWSHASFIVTASLRNGLGCLALAFGFAALGQRRHSPLPFLEDVMQWLNRLSLWKWGAAPGKAGKSDKELTNYIDELARIDKPE